MATLTKETFSQALTGKSLVMFHRLKGCANCEKMLPKLEAFEKDGVNSFDVDADVEKDLVQQYAPQGQWNLPLTVYFENGQVVNTKTGIIDLLDATKTLQNISEMELAEIKLNLDIELATRRKDMFNTEKALNNIMAEIQRRSKDEEIVPIESELECPEECNEILKSRGLGDTISKITHAMGIPECEGCTYRKEKLNKIFPYKQ